MTLAVQVRGLDEWVSVQRKLQSVAAISRVDVRVLRRGSAEVEIDYFGDEKQLATSLAQHDLELEPALPQVTIPESRAFVSRSDTAAGTDRVRVLRPRGF
jgi:hypothetical protein